MSGFDDDEQYLSKTSARNERTKLANAVHCYKYICSVAREQK